MAQVTEPDAIEEPFRSALVDALRIAEGLRFRMMLVGAFARELCLPISVRSPARKTRDADLAVRIDSWDRLGEYFVACGERFIVEKADYMKAPTRGSQGRCRSLRGGRGSAGTHPHPWLGALP